MIVGETVVIIVVSVCDSEGRLVSSSCDGCTGWLGLRSVPSLEFAITLLGSVLSLKTLTHNHITGHIQKPFLLI